MKKKNLLLILVFVLCGVLVGCEKNTAAKQILGSWKNDTAFEEYVFVYTFNEDGTGSYDMSGDILNFEYKIDGDKISFKYLDKNLATFETTFTIDGDVLNILDSSGDDTLYTKVK